VLVRYLVRDDEAAYRVAHDLINNRDVLIDGPVLLETEWVLRSGYKLGKIQIASIFDGLLAASEIRFDNETALEIAMHLWKNSAADFADCLFVARYVEAGCTVVATFDRKAGKLPRTLLLRA
jgi:predicted nucleic-acid-binding protein